MNFSRSAGVLMPVFSLPDSPEIGDFGSGAYRFVDFLTSAGQSIWQLLPFGPAAKGNSPYSSYSAFAGNPLFISGTEIVKDGLLTQQQLSELQPANADGVNVDYETARVYKMKMLAAAYAQFVQQAEHPWHSQIAEFCQRNDFWLEDFVLFETLAEEASQIDWSQWDEPLRQRQPEAIESAKQRLADAISFSRFKQFVFELQWDRLKTYANEKGVRIYGDMPIFVAHESADVWTNQHLFQMDELGQPVVVAGVPPDYFSETGQMWGNPLYRWDVLQADGFNWWIRRLRKAFETFDILRLDHFRGFESYWEIPADAENAIGGQWKPAPGDALFAAVREALGELAIVAEDLGLITDEVHQLRERVGFPGMRVLQFGFDDENDSYHRPDCYPEDSFAYTGTHDNETLMGWYQGREGSELVGRFLSGDSDRIHLDLIQSVLASAANTVVVPMPDLLGLPNGSRINTPGEPDGNWCWRCPQDGLSPAVAAELRQLSEAANRLPG